MRFRFTVEVEVERETGKFVSREEVSGPISEALDLVEADVDGDLRACGVDGDSVYNIIEFAVAEVS